MTNRIHIAVGSLDASADYAIVDRTTDGVNYEYVRGGARTEVSGGGDLSLYDYEFPVPGPITYRVRVYDSGDVLLDTYSDDVTPVLDRVWLKSPTRPFLNQEIVVVGWGDVVRPPRQGVFEVLGRSLPVAVTELRGSRRFALEVRAADRAAADELRLFMSFGDVVFLHVPEDCEVPGSLYAAVGNVTERRVGRHDSAVRVFELELTECARPDPSIVGNSITWAGVVSAYATWGDLLAGPATWADLLDTTSAPADEVVG